MRLRWENDWRFLKKNIRLLAKIHKNEIALLDVNIKVNKNIFPNLRDFIVFPCSPWVSSKQQGLFLRNRISWNFSKFLEISWNFFKILEISLKFSNQEFLEFSRNFKKFQEFDFSKIDPAPNGTNCNSIYESAGYSMYEDGIKIFAALLSFAVLTLPKIHFINRIFIYVCINSEHFYEENNDVPFKGFLSD